MRVAAGPIVALRDQHVLARAREQRRRGQAAQTAPDDDRVVPVVARFAPESHRTLNSAGSFPASPYFSMKSTMYML